MATLADMQREKLNGLTLVFREFVRGYDQLYKVPFPYVMSILQVLLQAQVDGQDYRHYHLHMVLQSPLRQTWLIKYLAAPKLGRIIL